MNEDLVGEAKWACPRCTFLNQDSSCICEMCDYTRSDADPTIQIEMSDVESAAVQTSTEKRGNEIAGHVENIKDEMVSVRAAQLHGLLLPPVLNEPVLPVEPLHVRAEEREQHDPPAFKSMSEDELALQGYCDTIEFPASPETEEMGVENLLEHLRSAYREKSYHEVLRACPKAAERLYHRYFSVVSPQRNLSYATAIKAWDALHFGEVLKSYDEWKEFLLKKLKLKGTVSKDLWQMLWAFAESEDRLLGDYSADEAWPSVIDSFVEWKYEKEGRTFKAESAYATDPSAFDHRWSPSNFSSLMTSSSLTSYSSSGGAGAPSSPSVFASSFASTVWSTDYRGLYNQGATCYMNSLLQTLFMTPEFRRSMYRWKGGKGLAKEEEEDESIPLQLKRLFARLQFGEGSSSVSTQALTKSFGWDSGQSFVQQDAQELCRILFDVIEEDFAGTSEEHVIQELYQGRMKDYVQCTVCGYESSRPDKFLDISLDIHHVNTLVEALDKFVTPEILSGSSRWRCSKCDDLVDARKGLKIVELPYILMVQLKRFDYNYDLNYRIKLNHMIAFPYQISLDKYVDDSFEPEAITHPEKPTRGETPGPGKESITRDFNDTVDVKQTKGTLLASLASMEDSLAKETDPILVDFLKNQIEHRNKALQEIEEREDEIAKGKEVAKDDEANQLLATKKRKGGSDVKTSGTDEKKGRASMDVSEGGEHNYELYSVLVHSGSATGGHYFAYIKSFEKNAWYEFNDSFVTEVTQDKIEQAFGSDGDSVMGTSYGCSAYMLCYRRVDPERNIDSVPEAEVDEELRNIKDAEPAFSSWVYNFKEKKDERRWNQDSSDDEADNEQGNTSDDMEMEDEAAEWNDDPVGYDESDVHKLSTTTTTTTSSTAPATEVIVATKEVLTEEEDLEVTVFFKHELESAQSGGDGAESSYLEEKIVRTSSNTQLGNFLKKLQIAFDLADITDTSLKVSDYNRATGQVGQPYDTYLSGPTRLRDLYIESGLDFMLEIKPTSEWGATWFSTPDPNLCLVLLVFETLPAPKEDDTEEGSDDCIFCSPKRVFVKSGGTLLDLKQAIHSEFTHLTPEKQRIIHSAFITKDLCAEASRGDSTLLSSYFLHDRDKLYVEYCEDITGTSLALAKLRGPLSFNFAFASSAITSSDSSSTFFSSSSSLFSSSSYSSSSSASTLSWRPKEKGIQIRRKADRQPAQLEDKDKTATADEFDPPQQS